MCQVSNRKCVRFFSSIPLKSMQCIKAWKGTLRLRAYNESLLQEIGNTVEPRLSGLVGTSVKSPDNRESG